MRVARLLVLLAGAGGIVAGSHTPGMAACEEKGLLEAYLEDRCAADPAFVPPDRALTFDHLARRWASEYRVSWDRKRTTSCVVELTPEGAPRARRNGTAWTYRARDERVMAFVTYTNAMLYSALAKESEPKDIEELASLRKVASILGSGVTAAIGGLAVTSTGAKTLSLESTASIEALIGSTDAAQLFLKMTPHDLPPPDPWGELAKSLRPHTETRVTRARKAVEGLKEPFEKLDTGVKRIDASKQEVVPYLQVLEDGRLPTEALKTRFEKLDVVGLDSAFQGAQKALAAFLDGKSVSCVTPYENLRDAMGILLSKDLAPGAWSRLQTMAVELANVSDAACPPPPGAAGNQAELEALRAIGRAIPKVHSPSFPDPTARVAVDALFGAGDGYAAVAKAAGAFQKDADELLASRADSISLAAALVSLRDRESVRAVGATSSVCPGAGVLEVPTRNDLFNWNTVYPHAFTVAADAPNADDIAVRHPDPGPQAYELEPRSWLRPVVSFGATRATALREPKFELIEIDGKKYVEKVSEESRTLVPTAFLSFGLFPGGVARPLRPIELAVDLGVGVDPGKPAFFVGGSVKLWAGIRLGAGRTWQKITALDGQTALSIGSDGRIDPSSLAGNDVRAIRSHTTFPAATYLSLSFPLNSLPFFGGGE